MTTATTASQRITEEVASWPGVEAGYGRRGEFAFRVGRRELGHLHGDHAAHFAFPKQVWGELFEQGRIVHHPVFPGKEGPAARRIEGDEDVDDVIRLMRLNYNRLNRQAASIRSGSFTMPGMPATDALIFDAIRTPRGRGKVNGSLHATKPVDLVVGLMHELLVRNERLDPSRIDDVVLGCVSPIGDQGADIAKTAALKAGLPDTVSGVQLNRFCASGLEAVNIAAQKVASGWEDLVLAGGVESMSRVPMGSDGGAWAMDPETNYDTYFVPQGIGADLIATIEEFSREDVDSYAARSQERAVSAHADGRFAGSLVPVLDINDQVVLDRDEHIREGTTVETLSALKPSFAAMGEMGGFDAVALQKYHWVERIDHVHTPGNSSGIVDGASLVAIGNAETGEALGLTARARVLATAVSGADPTIMLTGPAPAARKALSKAGIGVEDLDLVEINEAFAAVVLRFVRDMGLDMERVNVNGGAIAMGHPLGATGAMILGTLVDELHRTGGRYGLATLCVGGGMGIATVVEAI